MRSIIWSKKAIEDFELNLKYLEDYWSLNEAIDFSLKVEKTLNQIATSLVKHKTTSYPNIYQCVICKQITLIYKDTSTQEIHLLRFWNNTKNPKSFKLK